MLTLHDCVSEACNAATFKLLLDGVVIVAACPQDTVGFSRWSHRHGNRDAPLTSCW